MKKSILAAVAFCSIQSWAVLAPVNSNATTDAKRVYTYLQNLAGQGILSGQLNYINDTIDSTDTSVSSFRERYIIARDGGKYPAIYASNFGDWPMNYQGGIIQAMEKRWKVTSGQTVFMLCWHAVQPDTPSSVGYSGMSKFSSSAPYPSWKIDSILKPGTALNIEWKKRLDTTAGYLKQLDSAGIPVLWRPFHENNGAFFWWGQQPRFKELWQQMYNYYTDTLGLNNLLWVYSMCYFADGDTWIDSLYPGEKYVDVLGADIYTSYGQSYGSWIYSALLKKGNGKPIGISENGTMPYVPTLKYTQPKWTFFATWPKFEVDTMWTNDYYHPAGYSIENPDSMYKAVYGDAYTITRDEINFNIAADNHVFLTTAASPTNGGSVSVSPDSNGRYTSGTQVTATAMPVDGWVFTGWSGDTATTSNPIKFTMTADKSLKASFAARLGTNLLDNGNFSDSLNGWSFSAWETGAAATASVVDSVFQAAITTAPSDIYGVQLLQTGITLDSGATYQLSYVAKASSAREVDVAIGMGSGKYTKLLYDTATVGTSWTSFAWTFADTLPSSTSLRLEFELSKASGTVYLDSVKIAMIKASTGLSRVTATVGKFSLRRTSTGIAWSTVSAISAGSELRLVRPDGHEVSRTKLVSGSSQGRVVASLPRTVLVAQVISDGKVEGAALLAP